MNTDACVLALDMPLPEDILKRKWAGDLDGAIAAIDLRLQTELPQMLRERLVCERERLRRLPTQYPWNRAQALEKLQALVPDVTAEELDAYELAGKVDFIYINGEKRYFVRFHKTLAKFPELMRRAGRTELSASPWLDPMIAKVKAQGSLAYRITLSTAVYADADAFVPGEYEAWLPFPAPSAQQSAIELLSGDPDHISSPDAPARTAYWKRTLEEQGKFAMTYAYTSRIVYADPLHAPAPAAPLYPDVPPVCEDDLAEQRPYIRFTPYLKALAADVTAGASSPVEKAWRCYEYVTTKVNYSFMRDYFQIDDLGEYCAINQKGDCGLQALLFIILCRICGVPARWQSGMSIDEDYVGSHDWAQFYVDGWGWLFADPSYGGSAFRCGSAERHAYYFGNLDPMRMVANSRYQAPFDPPANHFRFDPYDNQSGELCRTGAEYPFTGRQLDGDADLVEYHEV